MNNGPITPSCNAYHSLFYRKALHPDLFEIEGRRSIEHGEYQLEGWTCKGSHALLFSFQGISVTEVVTFEPEKFSDRGRVACVPCAGERDIEETVSERIEYLGSMQTETLTPNLFLDSYNDLIKYGRKEQCLMVMWPDRHGNNLSVLDVQRYKDEVHAQGFHLRADCMLVLRTQSIFQTKILEAAE